MVIKVDKEGSELLTNVADLLLRSYGVKALQFVDILRDKIEIITDSNDTDIERLR
jgi:hypothetical protein